MKRKLSTLAATFALCALPNAQTVIYSDNFDDENLSGWTLYDEDGDGYNWGDTFRKVNINGVNIVEGALISSSWVRGIGVHPDDWAVTPAIDLSAYAGKPIILSWTVQSEKDFPVETYAVYAATANDVATLSASPVRFTETLQNGDVKKRTLDLSSLAGGGTVYVAFRHYDSFDQNWVAIDNVEIKEYPANVPPACPALVSPANGATGVGYLPLTLQWNAVPEAESYDVYFGEDPAALELVASDYTGTEIYGDDFDPNMTYYWKVIAKDPLGESSGCETYSFTTGESPFAPYCGPLRFGYGVYGNDYGAVEPITLVDFAGIHNETSNVIDGSPAHELFLDQKASVTRGQTYTFTIEGNTNGHSTDYYAVYIDWNQNGIFDYDENSATNEEIYFDVSKTIAWTDGTDGVQSTLDITVPETALEGVTRMRVKKMYATSPARAGWNLPYACESRSEYGQAEDYTVAVSSLGTEDLAGASPSLKYYPNPVTDFLNIVSKKEVKAAKIYDASGKVVFSKEADSAKNMQISMSSLATGVYVVILTFENGSTESFKVLKK